MPSKESNEFFFIFMRFEDNDACTLFNEGLILQIMYKLSRLNNNIYHCFMSSRDPTHLNFF